ncbi:TetR/AcrR family transcriptional regulator [Bradyrhizobium sp. WSM 1704]|uniref:TetR/AcrR family transcriptional regulator n=1 Tax=Bradyrhizobium semiaridum TaxID=2821404 RepID=UPI001CE2B7BA|nr:TetR/AcrR family transcriptional regulator [Bradyrhizobium semiaridum]MCA6126221.1 TetR/AcrR family transcriptional regulator [Bradyrhizobium semiaridum]
MPDGRQALLVAATEAFAGLGFDGADLRSVAAAANVSPNLIRVHFGNKTALWEACLDRIVAIAKPVVADIAAIANDASRPLADRLRDVIVRVGAFYAAHPQAKNFAVRHGAEAPERTALVTEKLLRPAYESVRELLEAGIAAGIVRSSHPALFFGLLNAALNPPPTFPVLLMRIAPEIDPAASWTLLIDTAIASLLHLPPSNPSSTSPQQ